MWIKVMRVMRMRGMVLSDGKKVECVVEGVVVVCLWVPDEAFSSYGLGF